jgi:hypothetical protein
VRLRSLLAEANANTRVRVAVVAPQQGQGGSATAAQLTQLFARYSHSLKIRGSVLCDSGLGLYASSTVWYRPAGAPGWLELQVALMINSACFRT